MPDITMCCNYKCNIKDECYRYRAIPDEYCELPSFYMVRKSMQEYINNEYLTPDQIQTVYGVIKRLSK
jgi:hypothetical protein